MEYCGNGDLGGYIKRLKEKNKFADEDFIWTIFAQLVGALYRCHYGEDPPMPGRETGVKKTKSLVSKQGHTVILHRDLKPENGESSLIYYDCRLHVLSLTLSIVFLGENNSVKLGDFGLSKIIASHDFASTYVGTPFYMSPEICAAERYSHFSDIWSLGCIIYELATRQVPFEAKSHMELIMKIKRGVIKPLPAHYSQDLTDAISWCLKVDPRGRPDTSQLLSMANIKVSRVRSECDSLLAQADRAHQKQTQQIEDLQAEVAKLRDASKRIEMEWHARATLAIDQKVYEAVEKRKAELLAEFDSVVDKRAEDKLNKHLASLPTSHGASQSEASAIHVRSNTPPPGKNSAAIASFVSRITEASRSSDSLPETLDDSALEQDLTSLSLRETLDEQDRDDENSPLARRTTKIMLPPKKATRKPITRAKTFAYNSAKTTDSPMDVHMADPSPMHRHAGARGLGLSPRRNGAMQQQQQPVPFSNESVKRNIFSLANVGAVEKENRPPVRGRTLVELSLSSPAKWNANVHGEDMPSPFLRRHRT